MGLQQSQNIMCPTQISTANDLISETKRDTGNLLAFGQRNHFFGVLQVSVAVCLWSEYAPRNPFHVGEEKNYLPTHSLAGHVKFVTNVCGVFMVFCHILCCFYGFMFSLPFLLFCRKICFVAFSGFCVEKNGAKNWACGEKMTNMRYGPDLCPGGGVACPQSWLSASDSDCLVPPPAPRHTFHIVSIVPTFTAKADPNVWSNHIQSWLSVPPQTA